MTFKINNNQYLLKEDKRKEIREKMKQQDFMPS